MGLSAAVNLKRLSILRGAACKEKDLEDVLTLSKLEHLGIDRIGAHRPHEGPREHNTDDRWSSFVQRLPDGCLPLLTSLELTNLTDCGEATVAALGRLTGLTSLNLKAVLDDVAHDVPLAPESLRRLSALTALRHLSFSGHAEDFEHPNKFLERALPVLHCLPSLVSLDVDHADWTEACIPLFPVQLQTLVTDLYQVGSEYYRIDENTAVLAALAERCPSLTSVAINEDHLERMTVEDLFRMDDKLLPWLRVNAAPARTPRSRYPTNGRGALHELTALENSLENAQSYLGLLKRSGQWNSPKNPCWNLIGSGEPWVAAAHRVSSLCSIWTSLPPA